MVVLFTFSYFRKLISVNFHEGNKYPFLNFNPIHGYFLIFVVFTINTAIKVFS